MPEPKSTQLRRPPLSGPLAYDTRVRSFNGSPFFGDQNIFGVPEPIVHGPTGTPNHDLVQIDAPARWYRLLGPDARGDIAIEGLDQLFKPGLYVCLHQVGAQQPHATVDIKAHAARGDYAVVDSGGGNASHREPISPMDIGHSQGSVDDARKKGDVGHLLQGLVPHDFPDHRFAGINNTGNSHPIFIIPWDLPSIVVDPPKDFLPVGHHLRGTPSSPPPLETQVKRACGSTG